MKHYVRPELEVEKFDIADVITLSNKGEGNGDEDGSFKEDDFVFNSVVDAQVLIAD